MKCLYKSLCLGWNGRHNDLVEAGSGGQGHQVQAVVVSRLRQHLREQFIRKKGLGVWSFKTNKKKFWKNTFYEYESLRSTLLVAREESSEVLVAESRVTFRSPTGLP